MSIKKWLWNDNASDLVNRRGGGKLLDEQRLDAARDAVRKHAPIAKQITREAFKAAGMALGALASAAAASASSESRNSQDESSGAFTQLRDGPEGIGYYQGGIKVDD
ncbi:hypothetical protein [Salinicola peritrichatus]|uniref:hypothetical protein n=1 Tax=Salinicola peritrichatus TaxID=1267424 RepID=UPI000DA1AA55|nr:hypothetical protein [Salinicola peritrichatus]